MTKNKVQIATRKEFNLPLNVIEFLKSEKYANLSTSNAYQMESNIQEQIDRRELFKDHVQDGKTIQPTAIPLLLQKHPLNITIQRS